MPSSINELLQIALPQYGCITYSQALEVVSRRQLQVLVKNETLKRVLPCVYAVRGYPSSWHQRSIAATLSVPGAHLSHRSAARLWGLDSVASERIHITASRNQPLVRPGVTVHRSVSIAEHSTTRDNIAVTTMARTIVDISGCLSPSGLATALDEAMVKGLVRRWEIYQCLGDLNGLCRRGLNELRSALAERGTADELAESTWELIVLGWLRRAELPEPSAQRSIIVNGNRYRPDLSYPEFKIAIEPDGPHHLAPSVARKDRIRDADFQIAGWLIIRVPTSMDAGTFTVLIRKALQSRGSHMHQPGA
jgi:very-short-patch-repair endonuclease